LAIQNEESPPQRAGFLVGTQRLALAVFAVTQDDLPWLSIGSTQLLAAPGDGHPKDHRFRRKIIWMHGVPL
jgi:hypothetical protein